MDFQTIESILKPGTVYEYGLHGTHFQTIESILKRGFSYSSCGLKSIFPDYWVYFKAIIGDYNDLSELEFPDYWVYFKAFHNSRISGAVRCISRLLSLF